MMWIKTKTLDGAECLVNLDAVEYFEAYDENETYIFFKGNKLQTCQVPIREIERAIIAFRERGEK